MGDHKDLGPGLHRVGPEPWDFVYNPAVGQKVAAVGLDGVMHTGFIKDFTEDKETGELTLTVQSWEDWFLGYIAIDEEEV